MQWLYFTIITVRSFCPPAFLSIHWKDFHFIILSFNSSLYIIYQSFKWIYNSLVKIRSINVPRYYPYSIRRWYTIRKFQVFFKPLFFLLCKICYFLPFIAVCKKSQDTYGKNILQFVFYIRRMSVIRYFCCFFWNAANKTIIYYNVFNFYVVIF